MSTILLAWELGGGLGHLALLDPPARELMRRGHRVVAALRDLSRAEEVFAGSGVEYLQAPLRTRRIADPFPAPCTFAHILHNIGLGNLPEMRAMLGAWRTIFATVQPDLVLFNHCPTGLLAARGGSFRQVVVGAGFTCPPPLAVLPDWRPWLKTPAEQLASDEAALVGSMNQLLAEADALPLHRLTDLYCGAAETMLATLPELDHYGRRDDAKYWGCWPAGRGRAPEWPAVPGQRVLAYLKPFAALPALLQHLADKRLPTLVYCDSVNPELQRQLQTDTLRFVSEPIDLDRAGRECDVAILNATHGVTAAMMMAGKPMLLIPLYVEQHLIAKRIGEAGSGIAASENDGPAVIAALRTLRESPKYQAAAKALGARYAGYDARQRIQAFVDHLES